MSYNPVNPNGQATSANSSPVVIASDQSAIAVTSSSSSQSKITDGTNVANTTKGDGTSAGQVSLQTGPSYQSQTFSVTSVTAGTAYDVGNYKSVSVQITSQYTGSNPTIIFECSNDNSTWFANTLILSSQTGNSGGSSLTTTTGLFYGALNGRYFRLNFTGTYSSGTAAGTIIFSTLPTSNMGIVTNIGTVTTLTGITNALPAGTNSIGNVGASTATGSAVPANAFYMGGQARTSEISAATNGNLVGTMYDKVGKLVSLPYSVPALFQNGTASATGTSSTSLISAVTSSIIYLTSVQVMNTGAVTSYIALQDGSGGTTKAVVQAPAYGGANITFPVPIANTNGNAWYFAAGSSSTTIYVSAQGYAGV